jgi:glycine cleavage system aminomethyltransferase T
MEDGRVPPEGGQVVIKERRPVGRVTSARWSPELRKVIGMAWVPAELAREGAELFVTMNDGFDKARVRLKPFFDPEGDRLRS